MTWRKGSRYAAYGQSRQKLRRRPENLPGPVTGRAVLRRLNLLGLRVAIQIRPLPRRDHLGTVALRARVDPPLVLTHAGPPCRRFLGHLRPQHGHGSDKTTVERRTTRAVRGHLPSAVRTNTQDVLFASYLAP